MVGNDINITSHEISDSRRYNMLCVESKISGCLSGIAGNMRNYVTIKCK